MKTFLAIFAVALFTTVGLCAAAMLLVLRMPMAAFVIMLLVLTVDITAAILLESDTPKPVQQDVKRVRTLLRTKGPAHTTIKDPDPDTHGDVPRVSTQAVYPKTARIRDLPEPMGL